jgi:hypothetical protein
MPEFGLSVHALGDAYAHSAMGNEELMYQPVSGHLAQFPTGDPHAPDFISLRPVLYVTYVRALYRAMASAAQHWPQHHIVMLMKDERFVTDTWRGRSAACPRTSRSRPSAGLRPSACTAR